MIHWDEKDIVRRLLHGHEKQNYPSGASQFSRGTMTHMNESVSSPRLNQILYHHRMFSLTGQNDADCAFPGMHRSLQTK